MIEVTLISVGFLLGFAVTTFSHKMGSRTVDNAYKNFMSPPPNTEYLNKDNTNSTSEENSVGTLGSCRDQWIRVSKRY